MIQVSRLGDGWVILQAYNLLLEISRLFILNEPLLVSFMNLLQVGREGRVEIDKNA